VIHVGAKYLTLAILFGASLQIRLRFTIRAECTMWGNVLGVGVYATKEARQVLPVVRSSVWLLAGRVMDR
jgi:hypothetical protein